MRIPIQASGEKKPSEIYVDVEDVIDKSTVEFDVDLDVRVLDRVLIVKPNKVAVSDEIVDYLTEINYAGVELANNTMITAEKFFFRMGRIVVEHKIQDGISFVLKCNTPDEAETFRKTIVDRWVELWNIVSQRFQILPKIPKLTGDSAAIDVKYDGLPTVCVGQLSADEFDNPFVIVDPYDSQRLICVEDVELINPEQKLMTGDRVCFRL